MSTPDSDLLEAYEPISRHMCIGRNLIEHARFNLDESITARTRAGFGSHDWLLTLVKVDLAMAAAALNDAIESIKNLEGGGRGE